MTASTYESTLRGIGSNLAAMLGALWGRHESGELTLDEFFEVAALLVVTANGQSLEVARLSVAAFIAAETGDPIPEAVPVELEPWRTDPERVKRALATIAAGGAVAGRLSRLAHAEPLDAAAKVWELFIRADKRVTGWRRQLDSDPCELCQWWAAESHKFSPTAHMPRHKGCACVQVPTIGRGR